MAKDPATRSGPSGGTLFSGGNWGNAFGGGRKPNEVRRIALSGATHGTKWVAKVAEGCQCVPLVSKAGEVVGYRFPALDELRWAIEYCARIGVPVRSEVTLERPEILKEIVDAMRAEKVPKETIAAVVKRLGETLKDDVG